MADLHELGNRLNLKDDDAQYESSDDDTEIIYT